MRSRVSVRESPLCGGWGPQPFSSHLLLSVEGRAILGAPQAVPQTARWRHHHLAGPWMCRDDGLRQRPLRAVSDSPVCLWPGEHGAEGTLRLLPGSPRQAVHLHELLPTKDVRGPEAKAAHGWILAVDTGGGLEPPRAGIRVRSLHTVGDRWTQNPTGPLTPPSLCGGSPTGPVQPSPDCRVAAPARAAEGLGPRRQGPQGASLSQTRHAQAMWQVGGPRRTPGSDGDTAGVSGLVATSLPSLAPSPHGFSSGSVSPLLSLLRALSLDAGSPSPSTSHSEVPVGHAFGGAQYSPQYSCVCFLPKQWGQEARLRISISLLDARGEAACPADTPPSWPPISPPVGPSQPLPGRLRAVPLSRAFLAMCEVSELCCFRQVLGLRGPAVLALWTPQGWQPLVFPKQQGLGVDPSAGSPALSWPAGTEGLSQRRSSGLVWSGACSPQNAVDQSGWTNHLGPEGLSMAQGCRQVGGNPQGTLHPKCPEEHTVASAGHCRHTATSAPCPRRPSAVEG